MARDWLEMKPGHFDRKLLPKVRQEPEGQGALIDLAEIAPPPAPKGATRPEVDGQADLFGDGDLFA